MSGIRTTHEAFDYISGLLKNHNIDRAIIDTLQICPNVIEIRVPKDQLHTAQNISYANFPIGVKVAVNKLSWFENLFCWTIVLEAP